MVNKKLHTVSDKSEELVEDLLTLSSESHKSMLKKEPESSLKKKLKLSMISSTDQLTTTFQNGS
jgi:hypothetical protein